MSLMAKVRPFREGNEEDGVGEIVDFSMKAPKSLLIAITVASVLRSHKVNDDQVKLLVDRATQNINPDKCLFLYCFHYYFLFNNCFKYQTVSMKCQKLFLWFIW